MAKLCAKNWELPGVEGVLFDKDGTLIDSHFYWGKIIEKRSLAISNHYGLEPSMFSPLCLAMGYSCEQRLLIPEGPVALVGREKVVTAVNDFLRNSGVPSEKPEVETVFVKVHKAFQREAPDFFKLLPGVEVLLKRLKDHQVSMAVVTSDAVTNTMQMLESLKLLSFFSIIIGRESTSESKESGVPAVTAATQMGNPPQAVVAIGDAPIDIVMAHKAGLKAAITVSTGQVPFGELHSLTPFALHQLDEITVKS
jgi:phosphoglycolate phosphatase